jgi:hypothetical protein
MYFYYLLLRITNNARVHVPRIFTTTTPPAHHHRRARGTVGHYQCFDNGGESTLAQNSGGWYVKSVFMIHVGGTRCVTSRTDHIMKIHARITFDC